MDYIGVFLYGFSGAVFGTVTILYVLAEYLKKQLKRYSKSSFEAKSACDLVKISNDIDAIKIRLSSVESIFNVDRRVRDDLL